MSATELLYFTVPDASTIVTGAIHIVGGAIVAGGAVGVVFWIGLKVFSAILSIQGHRAEHPAAEE